MDERALDERLVALLMATSRVLVAMSARSIATSPVEVTLNQYRALVVLAARSPIHMAELARELSLSPSSTTRLVERLERKGLVARAMNEASRRTIDLRLEPAGQRLVADVMAERRRQLTDLIDQVPVRDRAAMSKAFEDLVRIAGEPIGDVPDELLGRVSVPRLTDRVNRASAR